MTGLESILRYILDEKTNKIIPENIKKDVTILGVTGIVESGTDTDTATIYPTLGVQDNREGDINIGDLVDIIIDTSAENVKKGDIFIKNKRILW